MASALVYCLCPDLGDEAVCTGLGAEGMRVVHARSRDLLLEEIMQRRPDVLIYTLRSQQAADLAMLQLVRRLVPDLPVVLVADDCSLGTEKVVRELRPIYYAVRPVEEDELRDAVRAALDRRGRVSGRATSG
jgi:DNA-binding NarL/FixJ family response regulator